MKDRYTFLSKNWLRFGLVVVLVTFFSIHLQAQIAPTMQWDRTFGCNEFEVLASVQQTNDEGYILGGDSRSYACTDTTWKYGFWILKLDQNGQIIWNRTFEAGPEDHLVSVSQTTDGGYIVGCYSQLEYKYRLTKLNSDGVVTWEKLNRSRSYNDQLTSLQQTKDGGYVLGGYSWTDTEWTEEGKENLKAGKGNFDYFVVKVDSKGNESWIKSYGGKGTDRLYSLKQTKDGGFILGGTSDSEISGDKTQTTNEKRYYAVDHWIIKLDADGNKEWDRSLSAGSQRPYLPVPQKFLSLQQTQDKGYIIGGTIFQAFYLETTLPKKGFDNYYVTKLSKKGKLKWEKIFGGDGNDILSSVFQTADKGFILVGMSDSEAGGDKTDASKGDWDYWIVKLNAKGEKQWDKTLGGSGGDFLYTAQQTKDKGFIMGGTSDSNKSGDKSQDSNGELDFWIVKLSPELKN